MFVCCVVAKSFEDICHLCVDIFSSLEHVWAFNKVLFELGKLLLVLQCGFVIFSCILARQDKSPLYFHFPQACPDTWRQYHLTVSYWGVTGIMGNIKFIEVFPRLLVLSHLAFQNHRGVKNF